MWVVEPTGLVDGLNVGVKKKLKSRKPEVQLLSKNFEFYSKRRKNIWRMVRMNVS